MQHTEKPASVLQKVIQQGYLLSYSRESGKYKGPLKGDYSQFVFLCYSHMLSKEIKCFICTETLKEKFSLVIFVQRQNHSDQVSYFNEAMMCF